jgi:hypothetical protein
MFRTPRLLILLVIFLSQYIYAEGNLKDAQDGVPKAQYQYAMRLIEAGKKSTALDWFTDCCSTGAPQE